MSLSKENISQIKRCIAFIFVKDNEGNWAPNGTGFFVGVKNEANPSFSAIYFVTAKHVIFSNGAPLPSFAIRLNQLTADAQLIELQLKPEDVFTHDEADVDIAVVKCLPNQQFDVLWLPQDLICDRRIIEEQKICEGDEVFFVGLFTSHIGLKRNQPIIRFGRIALMTDEKVAWTIEKGKKAKLLDLYLLECQSFGGNSGSPVFFSLNPLRGGHLNLGGTPQLYLGGVMTGTFLDGSEIKIIETQKTAVSYQSVGIAAVTPAYKLHEILFSERLIQERKANTPKS